MKLRRQAATSSRLVIAASIIACGSILVVAPPAHPRAGTQHALSGTPSKVISVSEISMPEIPMPFRTGEILNYRVEWAIFPNAAALQMNVVERRNLLGWQTWHFRASAHSVVPARTLFEVDDQFDSYTDATTLESHQYELYLNEMGSKHNEVLHLIAIGQSNRGNVAPVIVQPGTRDPLGAFYALRAVDWQRTPDFHIPVYDGSDLYDVRARQESASDPVAVDAGNFQATKISLRLFEHGREVPHTGFLVWFAHNAARTPVLVLAEMPLGNARVELVATPS
ncbi:MAG TPA: DUF3108 domain-containing protein [Candidatus Acidoferrales bacterium]